MLRFDHIVPPPVAFYFNVTFEGLIETSFQEVSGLQLEMETETIKEGGENSFSYQVPTRRKHGNLVLKRSLMPLPHVLETYVVKVLENNGSAQIVPVNLTISLLDAGHFPLNNWSVLNAYPVKWDISALNSQKNELVIETLEMAYTNLIRMSIREKNNLSNGYNYKRNPSVRKSDTTEKGTRPPSLP